jgi:hypothetical protein
MNERIKELFKEAIDYADKTHTYTPEEGFNIQVWDKIRFEKFAELLIKETTNVIIKGHKGHMNPALAYDTVKQHFGVEE